MDRTALNEIIASGNIQPVIKSARPVMVDVAREELEVRVRWCRLGPVGRQDSGQSRIEDFHILEPDVISSVESVDPPADPRAIEMQITGCCR